MAMPDHKGFVRPSIPLDGTFSRLPSLLSVSTDTDEATLLIRSLRSDTAIAARVLQHMLDEGEALHHAVTLGQPTAPDRWPLMGPHSACLEVAIRYLTEYGRALGRE